MQPSIEQAAGEAGSDGLGALLRVSLNDDGSLQQAATQKALGGSLSAPAGGDAVISTDAGTLFDADRNGQITGVLPALIAKQQRIAARRRGHMNVGKGVICIRLDDGHDVDYSVAYPLLKARNMVGTFAVPSAFPNQAGRLTTAQIIEMVGYGNEIACHSSTHPNDAGVATRDQLYTQLVASRAVLEALDPTIRCELWVTPGTTTLFQTDSQWQTTAGQFVMANYIAAVQQTYSTRYWPNQEQWGDGGYQIDAGDSLAVLKGFVDWVVADNGFGQLTLHTYNLDAVGKLSTADFTALLDYIRAYMDQGALENLTVTGGLFSAAYGDWENILRGTDFDTLPYTSAPWGQWIVGAGAPVLKSDGGYSGTNYIQCNSTNYLTQSSYQVGFSDAVGGHYRLRGYVRNSLGGVSTPVVKITDLTTPANWLIDVTPTATTDWTMFERCFTVPPGLDRVSLVLRSSGSGYIDYDSVEMRRI